MNYNKFLKCNVDDCIERNGCILPEQIAELQDKLHRRNMQIKNITNKFNYLFGIEKHINDKTINDSAKVAIVKEYLNTLLTNR